MKKKFAVLLLCLSLCLALTAPASAATGEIVDSSTITVSVTELKPGYYLCAVWHGDTLLRLFDYTVGSDGKLEAIVEIGERLTTGDQVTVGISNANTDATDAEPIPPIVCTVKNTSSGNPNTPSNPSTPGAPSNPSGWYPSGGYDVPSTSYSVTVPSVTGGKLSVTPTSPRAGSQVTITATPNQGYRLSSLTVTDAKGNTVQLTNKGDGKYTFTMPNSKVTMDASFVPESSVSQTVFVDVAPGAFYADAVAWAVEKGITNGTGVNTFSPNNPCTRGEIVTFLWRANGSPKVNGNNIFADVDSGAFFYDAVLWAVSNGITNGTGANTFSPYATCTRGEAVTFLHRSKGTPIANGNAFIDVRDDAFYANAVSWAVSSGVTNGTGTNTFGPGNICTRGEIVTFLYRAN